MERQTKEYRVPQIVGICLGAALLVALLCWWPPSPRGWRSGRGQNMPLAFAASVAAGAGVWVAAEWLRLARTRRLATMALFAHLPLFLGSAVFMLERTSGFAVLLTLGLLAMLCYVLNNLAPEADFQVGCGAVLGFLTTVLIAAVASQSGSHLRPLWIANYPFATGLSSAWALLLGIGLAWDWRYFVMTGPLRDKGYDDASGLEFEPLIERHGPEAVRRAPTREELDAMPGSSGQSAGELLSDVLDETKRR
jgi:hypothetical protein